MTAPVGYVIFSTFNMLQQTLVTLPLAVRLKAEAEVSFRRFFFFKYLIQNPVGLIPNCPFTYPFPMFNLLNRLGEFLDLPEHQPRPNGSIPTGSIRMRNADVSSNTFPGNLEINKEG